MTPSELLEKYEEELEKLIISRFAAEGFTPKGAKLAHSKEPVSDKIYLSQLAFIRVITPYLKEDKND